MRFTTAESIILCLLGIPDPRTGNHRRHSCSEMLFAAVLSVMCGFDSYRAFARFTALNLDWLRLRGCAFANGVPSHDAFRYLFTHLEPLVLTGCLRQVADLLRGKTPFEIVAVDGKAQRRGRNAGEKTPFIVNAWSDVNGLVLGCVKVDEKSNEITAIPKRLRARDLEGCIVTIDAAGCQKGVASLVVGPCKANYVLALKDNQKTLHDEMLALFDKCMATHPERFRQSPETVEKNSGRIERRKCWQTGWLEWFADRGKWAGLRSAIMVEAKRTVRDGDGGWKSTSERRLYISSLPVDPDLALKATRSHWGVESMHWSLDVIFGEDYCRARTRHGAENRATVRRIGFSLLRRWGRKQKCGLKEAMMDANQSRELREGMLTA